METTTATAPKSNKIKILIIIGILLLIIFVALYVWKKYTAKTRAEFEEAERLRKRQEVSIAATTALVTEPTGVVRSGPGSRGNTIG